MVAAMAAPRSMLDDVDDDPSQVTRWLPAFPPLTGAPSSLDLTEWENRAFLGDDAVYYGAGLHGATNGKTQRVFDFRPRSCTREAPAGAKCLRRKPVDDRLFEVVYGRFACARAARDMVVPFANYDASGCVNGLRESARNPRRFKIARCLD
jgi:hypothetical protein